jgi:hypothetical protein
MLPAGTLAILLMQIHSGLTDLTNGSISRGFFEEMPQLDHWTDGFLQNSYNFLSTTQLRTLEIRSSVQIFM